ncbi:MAG: TerD family protein [Sediminibacterium sp.]
MSSFNLSKGSNFNLSKSIGFSKVRIGLGWNPNETKNGPAFDLDVSAFGIDSSYKIINDSYFIFYGQVKAGNAKEDPIRKGFYRPTTNDGAIMGAIDDPTGLSSDGDDDEDMIIDLLKVHPQVEQIIICASISKYPHDNFKDVRTLSLDFGKVSDCYIRIINESNGIEIAKYELTDQYSTQDAIEFGRLYRIDNEWQFEAMGRGHNGSLQALVDLYT